MRCGVYHRLVDVVHADVGGCVALHPVGVVVEELTELRALERSLHQLGGLEIQLDPRVDIGFDLARLTPVVVVDRLATDTVEPQLAKPLDALERGAGERYVHRSVARLAFSRAEIGSLFMAVLIGVLVCGDGQSNWYKGVQLITVYAIIALMFYLIPEISR